MARREREISSIAGTDEETCQVKQAIAGDPEAFARLYDVYVNAIYRFVLLRVSDRQTAEDLTSQVFLKAWESLGRYRRRQFSFRAWLFRVTRNMIIDHYRARKNTAPLEAAIPVADPQLNVKALVDRQLLGENLWVLLQQLSEAQREVLILKFVEEMSTAEVAQVMGKRKGAIRALQMRGLQALREMVSAYE